MINATVKQNIQDRIEARAAKKRKLWRLGRLVKCLIHILR